MVDVIAGHIYQWTLMQAIAGSAVQNVWSTMCDGTFGSVDMAAVAEAYWAHISSEFRGLYLALLGDVFVGLKYEDQTDQTGAFGEYAITGASRVGTRTIGVATDPAANFLACGLRLTVGTRATRPGQKRLFGLTEYDIGTNTIVGPYLTAAAAVGQVLADTATLGIPAAGVELRTVICRTDETGAILAHQDVTGYVVNTVLTSQRSRRLGHGI